MPLARLRVIGDCYYYYCCAVIIILLNIETALRYAAGLSALHDIVECRDGHTANSLRHCYEEDIDAIVTR